MKLSHIGPLNGHSEIERLDSGEFIPEYPIKWSNSQWWVIKDSGKVISYLCLEVRYPTNKHVYLSRSFVLKKYRGQGLHKRLIRAAVKWARATGFKFVWSSINPWNLASGNSLISCGFKLCKPVTNEWKEQLIFFSKEL